MQSQAGQSQEEAGCQTSAMDLENSLRWSDLGVFFPRLRKISQKVASEGQKKQAPEARIVRRWPKTPIGPRWVISVECESV